MSSYLSSWGADMPFAHLDNASSLANNIALTVRSVVSVANAACAWVVSISLSVCPSVCRAVSFKSFDQETVFFVYRPHNVYVTLLYQTQGQVQGHGAKTFLCVLLPGGLAASLALKGNLVYIDTYC